MMLVHATANLHIFHLEEYPGCVMQVKGGCGCQAPKMTNNAIKIP